MDELLLTPATFRAILDDASLDAILFVGLPLGRINRTCLWAAYWAPDGEL